MNEDALFDSLEKVVDEASFLKFVEALAVERRAIETFPETSDGFRGGWANQSILYFLEAGIAWANDSQFGIKPGPKPQNQWQIFAMFLWAGRSYE